MPRGSVALSEAQKKKNKEAKDKVIAGAKKIVKEVKEVPSEVKAGAKKVFNAVAGLAPTIGNAVGKGAKAVGKTIMKPVDNWIEKEKNIEKLKREKIIKENIIPSFGSVENYERLQAEEEERMKVKNSQSKKQSSNYGIEYAKRMSGRPTIYRTVPVAPSVKGMPLKKKKIIKRA